MRLNVFPHFLPVCLALPLCCSCAGEGVGRPYSQNAEIPDGGQNPDLFNDDYKTWNAEIDPTKFTERVLINTNGVELSRNDRRNRSFWNVDVKATREISIGKRFDLQLSAEVFNLLNDDTYQIYNPFTESGQQLNGYNEAQRRFGRRWQVGMRLSF